MEAVVSSFHIEPALHISDEANALDGIIRNRRLETLFQPVYDLADNDVFAYEALSRGPEDSALHKPERLFEAAARHHRLSELDDLCRSLAVERFARQQASGKLALNLCPSLLTDPEYQQGRLMRMLQGSGVACEQVILELTEHRQVDAEQLKHAVALYQRQGFAIALDDIGSGYSNLRRLAELKPDYLKLDKYFVSGVADGTIEADFVKLIVDLANRIDCRVIAEGIETGDELRMVHGAGVRFGQGYLLGRPAAQIAQPPVPIPEGYICSGKADVERSERQSSLINEAECVAALRVHNIEPCSPTDLLTEQLERFHQNEQLTAVPVVEQGRVLGALIREDLFKTFSMAYSHSLYHRSPVTAHMEKLPLVVDVRDALSEVSQQATRRPRNLVYSPLIVCDNGRYIGMASIRELLEKITRSQIEQRSIVIR